MPDERKMISDVPRSALATHVQLPRVLHMDKALSLEKELLSAEHRTPHLGWSCFLS